MRRRTLLAGAAGLGLAGIAYWQRYRVQGLASRIRARLRRPRSVGDAVAAYGPEARARLRPGFAAAGAAYPPAAVTLIGLKAERRIEVWAPGPSGRPVRVAAYGVVAASGGPGPKLREGDRQVPEGFYPVTALNPNSSFHLSLRVGYPSDEDRELAAVDGRTDLGGDIMIHGAGGSVGCLALTNRAIEEVFVLAADTGIAAMQVILAPRDLRGRAVPAVPDGAPAWTADRYARLHAAMAAFAVPGG
ncbi:MAG: hypothetical protein H6842_10640 [Rhodospirillaceae bacterium]|nr:hypothetical protein [Rhodospirillaceae bacterium]